MNKGENEMLIKCKFIDEVGNLKGRDYTYKCEGIVSIGDFVYTLEGKQLAVTGINLPDDMGAQWGDKLKNVTITPPEQETSETVETEPISADIPETTIRELSVDVNSVIVVDQLPMITEQLKALSIEIDTQIDSVLTLACTPETKTTIKKNRAALNTIFKDLESRRIAVKKQILAPYEEFDVIYKECVTNKFNAAFATLDDRTGAIDNELKNSMLQNVKDYFYEYALSNGFKTLTFEQSGIKVGLSDNKTALQRKAKEFIDHVKSDVDMINTQTESAEIMVEYNKTLNASQAIKMVKDRIAAVERQAQLQLEAEAEKIAEEKRRSAMARIDTTLPMLHSPTVISAPEHSVAKIITTIPKMSFTVFNETKERLLELKKFLEYGGYKYE